MTESDEPPARPAASESAREVPNTIRPNLLYLVHRFPYPPDKGDRIRAFHMVKFLGRRAALHLACLADEPPSEHDLGTLREHCHSLNVAHLGRLRWLRAAGSFLAGRTVTAGAFQAPALRRILRDWAGRVRFDACLLSASSMVPYLDTDGLRNVPTVVDLVDVDSQKWFDYAAAAHGPRRWLYRTEGVRLRNLEQKLTARTRAVTLVTEPEADLYRSFCLPGDVEAIPNGVNLDYFSPSPVPREDDEGTCVFVGALDYRPNVEGICWFVQEVWPRIRRANPAAMLRLVGRQPALPIRRLAATPGIDLIGPVDDVRPHLARSSVAVVPLRIARGVQNKVLEALAMGKAVVASPAALTGLRVEPGRELLSASTPEEWVATILSLFDDRQRRRHLATHGRRYIEEHHCWERCLAPIGKLLGLRSMPSVQAGDVSSEPAQEA